MIQEEKQSAICGQHTPHVVRSALRKYSHAQQNLGLFV